MDIDPDILQELLVTFRVELDEQSQLISEGLLKLEQGLEGSAYQDLLHNIFRAAHNIKGAARGLGITEISEIAHQLEDLFSNFRNSNCNPSAEMIDLSLQALDQIQLSMTAFETNEEAQTGDVQELLSLLEQVIRNSTTESAIDEKIEPRDQLVIKKEIKENPQQQEKSSASDAGQAKEQGVSAVMHVKTDDVDAVAALVEGVQVNRIKMDEPTELMRQLCAEATQLTEVWSRFNPGWRADVYEQLPDKVKELINISSEAIPKFNKLADSAQQTIHNSSRNLGVLLKPLQQRIRMLQLVPFANLLVPLVRSVRDISRQLEKQVNFETFGETTEIDRMVLEQLRDPMMHLLRNAVDHGIETPEQRQNAGKPEQGKVSLRVWREGNQVGIAVADDGGGINLEKIVSLAIKKKLITSAEATALTEKQKLDLLFHPGFSSKQIITDISGRGVGLDVVRANLKLIKGSVNIDSVAGQGSTFTLRVPLTLTTDHGLMVRVGAEVFAIPIASIECIMDICPDDIVQVEAGQAVLRQGRAIPLRDLATVLGLPVDETRDGREMFQVVVFSSGWRSVALLVDEAIGQQEMVVKALQAPLLSVRNVAGGTLTSAGGVVLVLNTRELVESALQPGKATRLFVDSETGSEAAIPQILVVDDSLTTRTLEKNILENNGFSVTTAVNGEKGWQALETGSFDLVVTDVEMPIMNGFELTERIKQDEKHQQTPVVIVTSLAKEEDRQRGIEVGADAYIVKGKFETKSLLDVVHQLV